MSKMSSLLAELCPDGVEYKKLIDVVIVQYGYPFNAKNFTDDPKNIPIIRIRDILSAKAGTYYKGPIIPEYIIKKGDILIGMDGNFNLEKWNDRDALLNQRVCKISAKDENVVLNGYLYHLLSPIFKSIEYSLSASTVKHLSAKLIHEIVIPVPPLAIQREIVRILDTFTELTAELTRELTTELTARRKQYEYYRDRILATTSVVEYKPLYAITDLSAGERITKAMMRGDFEYPVMGAGIVPTGYYTEWNRENCITISRAGAGAGSIGWHPEKFWATDVCFVAAEKNKNDAPIIKFVYYAIKAQENELRKHIYGGSMPKINKAYLWNLSIPVPPLPLQREIVRILDTFTNLTESLTQGLPAEIEARKKQYEYYRDKLLTFKRRKDI